MRYDCRDIEHLLNSDGSISLELLEEHLSECPNCRKLVQPDPKIEELLRTNLPGHFPAPLHEGIMRVVREEGICFSSERRWEISLPIIASTVLAVMTVFLILKWNEIRITYTSIDLNFLGNLSHLFLSKLKLAELGIGRMISYAGNEPLIFAASFATAALIWALSFLELEKIPN